MRVRTCERVSQCVLCLNLRFLAEDMPHLSVTEGLLIGDVMEVARILADWKIGIQLHTQITLPKSTQDPRSSSYNLCPEEGRRGGGNRNKKRSHRQMPMGSLSVLHQTVSRRGFYYQKVSDIM